MATDAGVRQLSDVGGVARGQGLIVGEDVGADAAVEADSIVSVIDESVDVASPTSERCSRDGFAEKISAETGPAEGLTDE